MTDQQWTGCAWNIFVAELVNILATRGLGLGHLDDRAHVHPEKIRRLRHSLEIPKSFPVLNPDELRQTIIAFRLDEAEERHLVAALLATAVEETLMDRIDPTNALKAAQ